MVTLIIVWLLIPNSSAHFVLVLVPSEIFSPCYTWTSLSPWILHPSPIHHQIHRNSLCQWKEPSAKSSIASYYAWCPLHWVNILPYHVVYLVLHSDIFFIKLMSPSNTSIVIFIVYWLFILFFISILVLWFSFLQWAINHIASSAVVFNASLYPGFPRQLYPTMHRPLCSVSLAVVFNASSSTVSLSFLQWAVNHIQR